jgi:hypothetical protein
MTDDNKPILEYGKPASNRSPERLSGRFLGWAFAMPFIFTIGIALLTTLARWVMSNDVFQGAGLVLAELAWVVMFLLWPILLLFAVFGLLGHTWRMWDWVILLLLIHGVAFAALGFYLLSMTELNF